MDFLSDWIKDIVVIVILAGFLEMLLPESSMKRFVKVLMGLFIILAIISPLFKVFNQEFIAEPVIFYTAQAREPSLAAITTAGQELAQQNAAAVQETYRRGLSNQIRGLVKLVEGVHDAEVEVVTTPADGTAEYGQIEKVVILLQTQPTAGTAKIAPVEVDVEPVKPQAETIEKINRTAKDGTLQAKVKNTVVSFYNLTPDQVEVGLSDAKER